MNYRRQGWEREKEDKKQEIATIYNLGTPFMSPPCEPHFMNSLFCLKLKSALKIECYTRCDKMVGRGALKNNVTKFSNAPKEEKNFNRELFQTLTFTNCHIVAILSPEWRLIDWLYHSCACCLFLLIQLITLKFLTVSRALSVMRWNHRPCPNLKLFGCSKYFPVTKITNICHLILFEC